MRDAKSFVVGIELILFLNYGFLLLGILFHQQNRRDDTDYARGCARAGLPGWVHSQRDKRGVATLKRAVFELEVLNLEIRQREFLKRKGLTF